MAPVPQTLAWRSLLAMYTIGSAVGLVTQFLPASPDFDADGVRGVVVTGLVAATWLAVRRSNLSLAELVLLLVYASVAVTLADRYSGSAASPFTSFQFWPVLCATLFLPTYAMVIVVACGVGGAGLSILLADRTGDGSIRWMTHAVSLTVTSVIVRGIALRISEHLRRLEAQSRTDPLTGQLNRRSFDESLVRECSLTARGGTPFTLAIIDIDHFKKINDSQGHAGGDAALRAVALTLRLRLRSTDDLFRIGGDEFALLLRGCTPQDAGAVIRDAVNLLALASPGLTLSVGIASCPHHGLDDQRLRRAADLALYQAKASGRARSCFARPDSNAEGAM